VNFSFGKLGRRVFERVSDGLVSLLAAKRISPHIFTLAGMSLTIIAIYPYSQAQQNPANLLYAGSILAVAGLLDALDGAVARRADTVSRLGAFLDSVTDRIADAGLSVGIYLSRLVDPLLIILMLTSSMLVSYTRARAESLGVAMKNVGIGERAVRIIIMVATTASASFRPEALTWGSAIVFLLGLVTSLQRAKHALSNLRKTA